MYQTTCQLSANLSAVAELKPNSQRSRLISSLAGNTFCYSSFLANKAFLNEETSDVCIVKLYLLQLHWFSLEVSPRDQLDNEPILYLVSWPCRHFSFSLSSYKWWEQQHACLLGNNCAGWGPRLPWTTMVCIICHLRGWLELRSFPFMSAGPRLLLRTLLPLCHFLPSRAVKVKPTIWAHTELQHRCTGRSRHFTL